MEAFQGYQDYLVSHVFTITALRDLFSKNRVFGHHLSRHNQSMAVLPPRATIVKSIAPDPWGVTPNRQDHPDFADHTLLTKQTAQNRRSTSEFGIESDPLAPLLLLLPQSKIGFSATGDDLWRDNFPRFRARPAAMPACCFLPWNDETHHNRRSVWRFCVWCCCAAMIIMRLRNMY